MRKLMSLSSVLVVLAVFFCLLALLAEITLFNIFKLPKADIDAYPEFWIQIEFAYWLGAFSEGWLFAIALISFAPSLKISNVVRSILFLLLCAVLVMTISIREVLWTF